MSFTELKKTDKTTFDDLYNTSIRSNDDVVFYGATGEAFQEGLVASHKMLNESENPYHSIDTEKALNWLSGLRRGKAAKQAA